MRDLKSNVEIFKEKSYMPKVVRVYSGSGLLSYPFGKQDNNNIAPQRRRTVDPDQRIEVIDTKKQN